MLVFGSRSVAIGDGAGAMGPSSEKPLPIVETTAAISQFSEDEGLPWNENVMASHYGSSIKECWGSYGNKLFPKTEFFVALPASRDELDCLGGNMACRMNDCDDAELEIELLLKESSDKDMHRSDEMELWPGSGEPLADILGWTIEGNDGDGLFRVIEIKMAGTDGPVFEAYVGDVGPWCQNDTYWVKGTRPDAEDGIDSHGRKTNRAGIDISYALAIALGRTGIFSVDWRWKTKDGAFVVKRKSTQWRN